ncbi:50S ribosomal protein L6 [Candidatus Woesearchaeota archaeon CG1_02_57_44]|nr:MAG: 50S ribosomal protein L6 [Candidatus Woesearchaeota archaeon CG1_02_57_44]
MTMKATINETVDLPEGVSASMSDTVITLKGAKGEISKRVADGKISCVVTDNVVTLHADDGTKREKARIGSAKAHIKNMIKGVTNGYTYMLKVCAGHFPMNITASKDSFQVKNFMGEKVPRKMSVDPTVKIKVAGDIITVEGTSKEAVSQQAARIEQLTRICGKDRRIFQDGIYITSKGDGE